jgi:hypothetical protein
LSETKKIASWVIRILGPPYNPVRDAAGDRGAHPTKQEYTMIRFTTIRLTARSLSRRLARR